MIRVEDRLRLKVSDPNDSAQTRCRTHELLLALTPKSLSTAILEHCSDLQEISITLHTLLCGDQLVNIPLRVNESPM